jgi:hypothetical protein
MTAPSATAIEFPDRLPLRARSQDFHVPLRHDIAFDDDGHDEVRSSGASPLAPAARVHGPSISQLPSTAPQKT